jgi:hypothetical protein
VTEEIHIDDDIIESYLCNETWMYYYSNPYDDALIDPEKEQKDILLGAFCEVFNFFDSVS